MINCQNKIRLPVPTNATQVGPIFEYRDSAVVVNYDSAGDNGIVQWISVAFAEVIAVELRNESVCSPGDLVLPDEIRCHEESDWLSQVMSRWSQVVGWQEYQKNLGGEKRFRHYQMYFDNVCAVRLIASDCTIKQIQSPT